MAEIIDLGRERQVRRREPNPVSTEPARIFLFDGVRVEYFSDEPRPQLRRTAGLVRGDRG